MASRQASMLSLLRLANSSRAFCWRLKSCTTPMPEMYSWRKALIRAMAVRMRRVGLRTGGGGEKGGPQGEGEKTGGGGGGGVFVGGKRKNPDPGEEENLEKGEGR